MSSRTLASPAVSPGVDNAGHDKRATARELASVAGLLTTVGSIALAIFYSHGEILLSGDAVAHINIARRVFDSQTPGVLQLGSVWLPLPHLLTIPFIVSDRMWRSGVGGSVVSVISFAIAGGGLFRLVAPWSRVAAYLSVVIFAANPNLLYVQTTSLNEPLYLATFIWAVLFFTEAQRQLQMADLSAAGKSLERGAIALFASSLTRYDGWFLSCVCWLAIAPAVLRSGILKRSTEGTGTSRLRRALLLTALGPILWMAYNLGAYKNPLEFANGPYSAKAIAQRSTPAGAPPYPGEHDVRSAAIYFFKAAQLNIGESFAAKLLCAIAALAAGGFAFRKDAVPIVLLWSPVAFYGLSVAYGAIPIFVPVWWPFSYYNVRYGLELLPALAVSAPLAIVLWPRPWNPKLRRLGSVGILFIVAAAYVAAWKSVPVSLREVRANGQARLQLDRQLAHVLSTMPPHSIVLAYTGSHSGAFELANFPLKQTINEGNLPSWGPSLASPARSADYIMASDDDPVAASVARHSEHLVTTKVFAVPGQARTVIYKSSVR